MLFPSLSTLGAAAQAFLSPNLQVHVQNAPYDVSYGTKASFTSKTLLEAPHLGTTIANPEGSLAAAFISHRSAETNETSHALHIVGLDADANLLPLKLDISAAGDAFWFDDSTLIYGIPNSSTHTTALYAHYVSLTAAAKEPGEYIGSLPTDSASNFRYSRTAQALVFSGYVFPDGDLSKATENGRNWENRKDTALVFDGSTFIRIFDKYTGPRQSSLFTVRLTIDWNGRWSLGDEYINILYGTGHHTPVEGGSGGRSDFQVSDYLVVYTAKDPSLPYAYHSKQNIYVVDIFGRTPPRELTSGKHGATSSPVFSPDGTRVAWLEMYTDGNEADKNRVVVHHLETDASVSLLRDWDRSPNSLAFSDDGQFVYMSAPDIARIKIFVYPLSVSGADKLLPKPATHEGIASQLQPLSHGRLLFAQQSMGNPGDIFVLENLRNVNTTRKRQLTHLSRDSLRGIKEPERNEFYFKGAQGRRVHGIVINPIDSDVSADKNKTWPAVLIIHGGPEYFTGDTWSTTSHPYIFSHHGYYVIAINPTGSTSFGRKLTDAIIGDWGGAPFEDLRKGFQHALKLHPGIDPERTVAYGGSYGGYAINWIQSNPEFGFNFKALTCFAGVFDLQYMAYTTDQNYFMNYEWTGTPWEKNATDKFALQSPSNFVHKWSTPELVLHGDIDFRVPVTEGLAAFSALQQRGVPSRLVIFKEESHGLRKPENTVILYDEIFRWFDHFVGINATTS